MLHQPVASQIYLLRLTPARQTALMLLDQSACNGHRQTLFCLPRIISLFIRCIRIIWNNFLVGGRARGLNPGHWACHPLLHMVPKCLDHWATWAGGRDTHCHVIARRPDVRRVPTAIACRLVCDKHGRSSARACIYIACRHIHLQLWLWTYIHV